MSTENNCQEDYTYEKFILYLYLQAAYADYQIQDEEIDLIKDKLASYNLIRPEVFDKTFHQVLRDFKAHNDFETMQHIEHCCDELHLDKAARQKIFRDFQDIIMADGKKEDSERINMFKFRKILGVEAEEQDT